MPEINASDIKTLTDQANRVVEGSYGQVDELFRLTDKSSNPPELAELAEAFGMMTVKVEAREFALEKTIAELKKSNEQIAALSNQRSLMSKFFVSIVLLVTSYIFILGIVYDDNLSHLSSSRLIARIPIVEIVSVLIMVYLVKAGKLRIRDFGVTTRGLGKALKESLIISAGVVALLAFVKFWTNRHHPGLFRESQIIDLSYFQFSYIAYLVVAPVQEFLTRGGVQGTLEKLLDSRYNRFLAILVTTFLFGALHMMISLNLAIVSFATSLLWGWMYQRHGNIWGTSLSHFLIGDISGLMGYWVFL